MKLQLALLLCLTVVFTSCDKEFGTPCPTCTPGVNPKSSIVLQCHVTIPQGLYAAEEATKIVDKAMFELLDATTREVVARKEVAIKGNGDVVDTESAQNNTAFLYSSEVKIDAPWGVYLLSFDGQNQSSIIQEKLIDCSQGYSVVRFNY